MYNVSTFTEADPGFSLIEGAQKIMCAHAHHEREARALAALGSLMLSRAVCALFCIHSDTEWELKNV